MNLVSEESEEMIRPSATMLLACFAAVVPSAASAQDRASVVPDMKVLLDNSCVRVQRHDVGVGGTIPMHSHPGYVVHTLSAFRAQITLPDGTKRISDRKKGETYWNPPISHSVKNLGKTPIHNLIVEIKPGGKCQ